MSGMNEREAQELARKWAQANQFVHDAELALSAAHAELKKRTTWLERCSEEMMRMVGRNITTKMFQVDQTVVIVEYEKGVRQHQLEPL